MDTVPIIPGLVRDNSIVIYEMMCGLAKYRMSMVSLEWHALCIRRIRPVRSNSELWKMIEAVDILRVLKYGAFLNQGFMMRAACKGGNMELIGILIVKGTRQWHNGLIGACEGGSMEVARLMIEKGIRNYGIAMQCACQYGYTDVINLLREKSKDNLDEYCLIGACSGGNVDIFKQIIHTRRHWQYHTLFYHACMSGCMEIIEILITAGCCGWNEGLYGACIGGHVGIATDMISRGANDWEFALESACGHGHVEVVKLLLERGANTREIINSAMFAACRGGCIEIVQMLIDRGGCNWNEGLEGACIGENIELVRMMINRADGTDIDWNEALGCACSNDNIDFMEIMIEHGADSCGSCGQTIERHRARIAQMQ